MRPPPVSPYVRNSSSSSANRLASGPKWLKCLFPCCAASAIFAFISARSKRWNESPSTIADLMCSRVKIHWNVRVTDVVPAPDEPVTLMIGCSADMVLPPGREPAGQPAS